MNLFLTSAFFFSLVEGTYRSEIKVRLLDWYGTIMNLVSNGSGDRRTRFRRPSLSFVRLNRRQRCCLSLFVDYSYKQRLFDLYFVGSNFYCYSSLF